MATVAEGFVKSGRRPDLLSGTERAHALDRWIYVFTAASFIVITLTGFIPDSLAKIAAVETGQRPPFPLVLHIHAVLMGSFLLLLLAQTVLVATGRPERHQVLGRAAMVLVPALVLAGLILVPTIYRSVWNAAQAAPPQVQAPRQLVLQLDNIMLMQLRIGFLFPLFLFIGLKARGADAGLHKRMMILGTAMALAAAIDRITWLPTTLPTLPLATDLYTVLAITPMFMWDLVRNGKVHRAYVIWMGVNLPIALILYSVWNTPWWHGTAPRLMGL